MKKYKLIKEYPGSPKLGFINGEGSFTYGIHIVEKHPEFWELVVEKDYEILSLSYFSCITPFTIYDIIKKIDNQILYYTKNNISHVNLTSVNKNDSFGKNVKIYSIKRLSDGEIFTIGDKINFNKHCKSLSYPICVLDEIITKNDTLIFKNIRYLWNNELENILKVKESSFLTEDNIKVQEGYTIVYWIQFTNNKWSIDCGSTPYYNASVLSGNWKAFSTKGARDKWLDKEYPKSLFTTEDGVDIFGYDVKVYEVFINNCHFNSEIPLKLCNGILLDLKKIHPVKIFSTKEKAEEYILMNKKILNINDILEVWSKLSLLSKESLMEKSKLMSKIVEFVKLN